MSFEEHLNIFVKQNMRIILGDPFPETLYEKERSEHYRKKLDNKVRRPKKSEVALKAMEQLIKGIKTNEDLNIFLTKPFINKNLSEKNIKIYQEIIELKTEDSDIDFSKIKEQDYKEEVKKKLKKEVIEENTEEISKAIQEIQNKYDSMPSVLDASEFEEPELVIYDELDREEQEYMPWYGRLNLISDPFPGNGLDKISNKIWDKIVYKTSIFLKYQTYITDYKEELFKNRIFYGTFGSGKSTFFEYIQPQLISNKIIPLYILLYGKHDAKSLQIIYEKKLADELIKACNRLNIFTNARPSNMEELIDTLFELILASKQDGVLIIIDDLHKNRNLEPAMEFMSYLQSYTTDLLKQKPNLKFGVYVAGSYDWKQYIQNEPIFSGSFRDYEDLPFITPEIACKAINMRFKAFSENPENPKQIELEAMKRAFDRLIESKKSVNFRNVIDYLIAQFKNNNYDILTTDSLPLDKIKQIRRVFDNNHILNTRFNMLINGTDIIQQIKYKENIRKLLSQLIKLYLRRVIYDNDSLITENSYYFKRLADVGLITKVIDENNIKWIITNELIQINDQIKQDFDISLENYLIDIYCYDIKDKKMSRKQDTMVHINNVLKDTTKNIRNNIINSYEIKLTLEDNFHFLEENNTDKQKRIEIRDLILESMKLLTKSICLFEHIKFNNLDDFWSNYWYMSDNINTYIRYINNSDTFSEITSSNNNLAYFYQVYNEAHDEMFKFITNHIYLSKYWKLPVSNLKSDDILYFDDIRDCWAKAKYRDCYIKASNIFEDKLRNLIFNTLNIMYGYNYIDRLDPSIRVEVYRRDSRKKNQQLFELVNEESFEQINRHHFKKILYEGSYGEINWGEVFLNAFRKFKKYDFIDMIDDLVETSNNVINLNEEFITNDEKDRIYNYIQNVIKYIQEINSFYLKLLKNSHRYRHKLDKRNLIYFSFKEMKDIDKLTPIEVDKDIKLLFEIMKSQKEIENIPLEDKRHIERYFNIPYRKFYALVSLLTNIDNKELVKTIGGNLSINTTKYGGSTVNLKFIQSN